jgi:hypothetical protein
MCMCHVCQSVMFNTHWVTVTFVAWHMLLVVGCPAGLQPARVMLWRPAMESLPAAPRTNLQRTAGGACGELSLPVNSLFSKQADSALGGRSKPHVLSSASY